MFDWLRKAAQGVGNFIYNSTPVGGAIKTVQRNQQVQQQARNIQRGVQQVQRQIPQPPPVPKINLPKINLTQANNILNSLGKFGGGFSKGFQQPVRQGIQNLKTIQPQNVVEQYKKFTPVDIGLSIVNPTHAFSPITKELERASFETAKRNPNAANTYKKIYGIDLRNTNQNAAIKDAVPNVIGRGTQWIPRPVKGVTDFVGENIVRPTYNSASDLSRLNSQGATELGYTPDLRGGAKLGTDLINVGSLAYSGALSKQLAQAGLREAPKLALRLAPRLAATGAGTNLLNQVAQGKNMNELDLGEAALSGAAYTGLGLGIPVVGKGIGKGISKILSKGQAGLASQAKNTPITVKTFKEKGQLLQDGYTNVKVNFGKATHAVDPNNSGAVLELAPKGIKGVKIDKATQEAVDAGALSPQLAQQGYKVTPELEIIAPNGKKLSIGEIQQLEQSSALTKAEVDVNAGKISENQAESVTKKLGRQIYAETAPQPRDSVGRYGRKNQIEIDTLAQHQQDQLAVMNRTRQGSPEWNGAATNYRAAQARIDQLMQPKRIGKPQPIYETVPKGTFSEKGLSGDKKIGNKFERQLGKQYESSGSVEYTGLDKGMKDGGIDLTVKNNDGSISLIQAKVRGQKTSLHEKPVQAFWNAFQQYTKDNPGVRVGAILHTTSRVDPDAIKFANSHGIKIIQQNIDGTGQKVITSGKPVKLKPYQVAISGQELSRIQNSIPVSNRSQFLKDIQNPDSDISKAFGSVERSRWLSMASDYYKASNPQGTYELGALKGLSSKLSRASTQEEVKKIIQDDIASNSRLGGFNPIDQKVLAQLEDSSFVSKIIKSNNPSEIRKLIGGDLYQPIKGTTNLRVETESPILLGGDKERGFISNVRSSSNTEDTTRTILSQASGYTPKSNKVLEVQANKRVIADPSEARAFALSNTNDEAVATAGQLIKHYQNTGDYGAAAQVADDVAKRLTEAGRTVQAASLYGRLSPVGVVQYAAAKAKSGGKELSAESSEVLTNLAKKIEKMSDGEDRQIAIKEMMDIIGKAKGSAISDKIITLWKSGLLTSPVTTAGNLTSNTFKQIVKKASDDPIAAVTDMLFSVVTGKRTKTFTGRGLLGGAGEGSVRGIKYFKTGYDIRNPIDKLDSKQVYFSDSWAGKVAQTYSDSVFRLMGAQDQPYFYAALRNTLYDQALAAAKNQGVKGQARDQFIKKFVNNTPSDIMDVATEEARQAVFQNKTMLSSIASKINQSDNTAVRALGQFLMPFSKVPSAVATEIFDRTPLGAAKEIVKQVAKRKFDQRAMSNAIAKSTTGTVGIMGLGYALDRGDSINLAFPQSETERNLWELEGRQPFSVKIGDKWISLNYVQPFGSLIAMGAQYHRSLKDGGSVQDALASSAAMGAKAVTEQSFLRGVGGALGALQDPARQAERYVEQTAGSVIPNFIRTTARATDPVQRQINNAGEAVIAGVPGLRQTLLPKQNVFGQEIARADSPLGTMINPFRPTTAKSDPTIEELRRLYDTKNGVLPSELDKSAFGKDKQITPAQINELQASVGQPVLERWQKIMADYRYKRLSDEDKAKVLKDARDAVSRGEKYAFAQDNGLGDTKLDKDSVRYLEGNEKDYLARDLPKRKAAQASSKPKRVAKAKKGRKAKVGRIAKSSAPKLRSIKLSAGKVPKISRTAKVKFRRYA